MSLPLRSWQCRMLVILAVPSLLLGISEAAFGQKNQPSSVRCRFAANPYRLPHECVGRVFDSERGDFNQGLGGTSNLSGRTWHQADRFLHNATYGESEWRAVAGIHVRGNIAGFTIHRPEQARRRSGVIVSRPCRMVLR